MARPEDLAKQGPATRPPARFIVVRALAWFSLLTIVVVTVVPAEFRPTTMLPLKVERALGFAVLSFIFALAYPRRWRQVLFGLVVAAFGIEGLQLLVPSRDPSLIDAAVKALGAASGVVAAKLLRFLQAKT